MSRNAIEVYDPEAIARQVQLDVRRKMEASGQPRQQIRADAPIFKMFAETAAKEAAKFAQREEERRKRDPTYRPDALDFTSEPTRAFDRTIDYYARLGLDQFASSLEIKKAYMKLSLKHHPDKQVGKTDEEVAKAIDEFKLLTEAYEILGDQPTRRQYDRERDKRSASYDQFGFNSDDNNERTPPTCEDVVVTLEQLYRGVIKSVRFSQRTWEHWSKTYTNHVNTYSLKINRGMLEGSTFWYKREGHQEQGKPRADLVFILKQEPHSQFERIGDDVWYYVKDEGALLAASLLFAKIVPTIEGKSTLALGNTLPALLGYDRSGVGEAIVEGRGMPLRDPVGGGGYGNGGASEERTRGDLIVKFVIELPKDGPKRVEVIGGGIATPPIALLTSSDGHGGKIEQMTLNALMDYTILPSVLWQAHSRFMQSRKLAASVLNQSASLNAWERIAAAVEAGADATLASEEADAYKRRLEVSRREALRYKPSDDLIGVYLRVAPVYSPEPPSECAQQLMDHTQRVLPQLQWRVIQMVSGAGNDGLSEPLVADEEEEIAKAAIVLIEATPDEEEQPAAAPVEKDTASKVEAKPPQQRASKDELYRVVWHPGVRVRSSPSDDATVLRIIRGGRDVKGTLPDANGWVQLKEGGWMRMTQQPPTDTTAITATSFSAFSAAFSSPFANATLSATLDNKKKEPLRLLEAASSTAVSAEASSNSSPFIQTQESREAALKAAHAASTAASAAQAEATRLEAAYKAQPRDEAAAAAQAAREAAAEAATVAIAAAESVELAAEAEEEAAVDAELRKLSGGDVRAKDRFYMSGKGCHAAINLMSTSSALSLYNCHKNGGLLIGIDQGCVLLSRQKTDLPGKRKAVHVAPGQSREDREAAAREAELAVREAAASSLPQWPTLLPFAIGLPNNADKGSTTSASERSAWRDLRGGAYRANLHNCGLGFCALGLPHGSALTALTSKRYALRSVLGGAQPLKVNRASLDEAEERRKERLAKRKADEKRLERLAQMAADGATRYDSEEQSMIDMHGSKRGKCNTEASCPGWATPYFPMHGAHALMMYCLNCGCGAWEHEELRRPDAYGGPPRRA